MAGKEWMIYGANGYTGSLIAAHAAAHGLKPVLAGRREEAIRPLAEKLGLPYRIFTLADAATAAASLAGIGTLLLAAGPFSATSARAIDACVEARANYIDITGEFAVFEAAQRRDTEAKTAGITILPGAGFDVVPSDCLAMALHSALPQATHLTLAIVMAGSPGPGTIKTAVEGAADAGWIRRAGNLERVPAAWRSELIPFWHGPKWAMTIPWGDLSSAYWSTKIPDIEVYMATPRPAIWGAKAGRVFMRALQIPFVQRGVKRLVDTFVSGGEEDVRRAGWCEVWGRVEDKSGRRLEGRVQSMETTTLTAHTTVDIVLRLQRGEAPKGYTTPSLAFGEDYIRSFPQTRMILEEVVHGISR